MFRTSPSVDPRIRASLEVLDDVPPELRDLLAGSDEEFCALNSMSLNDEPVDLLELLSRAEGERAPLDREILSLDIFGTEFVSSAPAPPLYPETVDPDAELRDMVQRTVAAVIAAAIAGDPAATAFLRKDSSSSSSTTKPRPAGTFVRRMAELADEFDSPVTRFLKAYVANDQLEMRAAVREMLAKKA